MQGICFSGGGIRSATFNLGVLQGLANLRDEKFGNLNHFDYLSSVSGGGYIHEWFAAWIKREEHHQKEKSKQTKSEYVPGSGFREVEKRLVPLPSTADYPAHPEPIRWLRRYSNYLTPQKGLFTGDTWVAVAIWLRNTFLNQLILVSGLFFLLLLPYLLARTIDSPGTSLSIAVPVLLFLLAVATISIELQREYRRIRYMDERNTDQQEPEPPRRWGGEKTVQAFIVLPLLLASVLHLPAVLSLSDGGTVSSTAEYIGVFALLWFLVASAAASGSSVKVYKMLHRIDTSKRAELKWWPRAVQATRVAVNGMGGLVVMNAVLSALAGTLLFAGVRWMLDWNRPAWIPTSFMGGPESWRFHMVFGPPLLLAVPFFTIVIGAGLVGRDFADWLREWLARVRAWALLFGFGWGLFFGITLLGPHLVHWLTTPAKLSAAIAWVGSTAGAVLAGKSSKTGGKPTGGPPSSVPLDVLAKLGAYAFVLGLLVALSFAVNLSFQYICSTHSALMMALLILAPLAIFALFGWRVDVNGFSMNPFYRNRLTRCYLGASNRRRAPNPLTGFDDRDTRGMQVSHLTPADGYTGPLPIICTTINLSFGQDLAWQERKAASFAFSPVCSGYHVGWTAGKPGTPLNNCGFVPTSNYAFPDGGINMATAVAISGAAASPNWGSHTDPAIAFLMTMFNVRLGWWLCNPRRPEKHDWASPRFAPLELTKELLGMVNDTSKFVYLSDGGHFENMGLYELVRRRCYRIVICDAEQDENYRFEGIANAIRKCRVDFGVEITLDLGKLRLVQETGNCQSHWADGSIRYPETPDGHEGKILYIKSSLTGAGEFDAGQNVKIALPTEPLDIINYKFTHEHFPHDTTANQWFTESQFESYRRLGYHIIEEIKLCKMWEKF
ncbi:MAG: acyltransferase [Acidobacteriia bacterium]|nr:acyltransferase [Terriglobia bacterium]